MKIQHNRASPRQQWLRKPRLSGAYQKWLIDKGSLTARLKARYTDFAVQTIALKYAKPSIGESALLRLPAHKTTLIREVLLMGNNQAVVFAHSVLPRASLRGAWQGLGKLGNKPLGATLFANPVVKRTPLEYKKISACSPIAMRVAEHLNISPQALWARRSIFSLNDAKILVTEVFLPQLFL